MATVVPRMLHVINRNNRALTPSVTQQENLTGYQLTVVGLQALIRTLYRTKA